MSHSSIDTKSGYQTAFKATALFGGVQAITIIVSILKSKVVAIWLGATGFGIMSLFNATTSLIFSITNLGLQSSAVRDIAKEKGAKNYIGVSQIIKAINRWLLATGLCGAIIMIVLSPWLSQWLFDSNQYISAFILLSCVVFLTGIYNGNYAVLQGMRKLSLMAKANVVGSISGFICSAPLYYFFRENGIVWAMILTALSTTIISFFFVKKVKLVPVNQTCQESFKLGLKTVKLGIMMAISSIAVLLVQFIVKTFIVKLGGLNDVGYYQAGWALNATYLGMVFTAMGKDYFPRLSQTAHDNRETSLKINEQAEIAILILAPFIIAMIVFMPFLIKLLYSEKFLVIIPMTKWLLIGSLVKAGSWGLSFVFLAKGDGKTFLFNELGIKLITIPAYLLGYYVFGLVGIGYAYVFGYTVYFVWIAIIAFRKYKLHYKKRFWMTFFILFTLIIIFPLGEYLWDASYYTGIILILVISAFSLFILNERVGLIQLFRSFVKKK